MATDSAVTRRWWVIAVVAAVALVIWVWRGSDETRIAAVVDEVSAALTQHDSSSPSDQEARLRRGFQKAFAADARVSAPDLAPTAPGPDALAEMAWQMIQGYDSTSVQPGPPTIRVGPSGREANALFQVISTATGSEVGTLTDKREARVELRKTDAGWRIVSVVLSARSHDEPEARP